MIFNHVGKRCIAGLNLRRCIIVSVINAEGPPVPIPNTEVKLCSADNTWLATARKDRSTLTRMLLAKYCREHSFYSSLAQSVERMTVNHDVAGSSPAGGAKTKRGTQERTPYCFGIFFVVLLPPTSASHSHRHAVPVTRGMTSCHSSHKNQRS